MDKSLAIGSPLCSAIACALTKAIGKPVTIDLITSFKDGKSIQITYRILEPVDSEDRKEPF